MDLEPVRRSPGYRWLLTGHLISLMGTHMRYVALTWQVFQITDSSVAVGLLGLAELIPLMAFSLFSGAIADMRDRKKVLRVSQLASAATSCALAALAFSDSPSVIAIYALTAAGAAIDSLERPARTAMIPSLVPADLLASAMALRQMTFQFAQIVGPAVGGLLIATFDVSLIYVIDAASFLVALASLARVPARGTGSKIAASWQTLIEGLRFSLRSPLILSALTIDLIAMVFGMPRALFPAIADDILNIGSTGVGFLYAAPAVGAFLAVLTSGWVSSVRRQGLAVFVSVIIWGLAITAFGLTVSSVILSLVFLVIAGGADVISAVFRGTIVQANTPDELRGRVTAVNILVVAGGPRLGDVEAGGMARFLGVQGSVVFGGLACLVGTGVVALVLPILWRHRVGATARGWV